LESVLRELENSVILTREDSAESVDLKKQSLLGSADEAIRRGRVSLVNDKVAEMN
jgi:hypothetical protein